MSPGRILSDLRLRNGDVCRSQSSYTLFYENHTRWYGGLTVLRAATSMYMIKLSEALGKGALAQGAEVYLSGNQPTAAGKQAVRDAAKARGLKVYF